jgi:thymidylate synthase
MLAHVAGLTPARLVINAGDAHLYTNHLVAVAEQLERPVLKGPRLWLDPAIKEIDDFRAEHISIHDYHPHAPIKADVAT